MTIREAAGLLGVHPNTVKNRLRKGMYSAGKVFTEHGETWMIDRDSLFTNTPSTATQTEVSQVTPEALTRLAREIVREAGLRRDPEAEARLEASKLEAEAARTQVLISSGAFVGVAAVVGILPTSTHLLYIWGALFSLGLSLYAGILHLNVISRAVAERADPPRMYAMVGAAALAAGVVLFAFYILSNIPKSGQGGLSYFGTDPIMVYAVAATIAFATGLFGSRTLWRQRTPDSDPDH